ncbi:MAG TPA: ferritin-like domain-containing protein [Patescibacteria group bacterium]|nr:ferritin-like domain-containing protein [Patescibacteria group bacterium]
MNVKSFEDLFIMELSDVYSAEKQLTKALKKMSKAASDEMLAEAFMMHLEETEGQVARIEELAKKEGLTLKRIKCEAMEGLIAEGQEAIDEVEEGPLLDVALIMAAQKVEHYEIAAYGSLVELSKLLGYADAEELLNETLEEEKATDVKLTEIAVGSVNEQAEAMRAEA